LFVAACLAFSDNDYKTAFTSYMKKYGKTYQHDAFQYRYQIFKKNMDYIASVNAQKLSYQVAINEFADLTSAEFVKQYTGLKGAQPNKKTGSPKNVDLPLTWDWNTMGAVTPIKNQQQCGSCWAFSTTGSTEGCHFITTNTLNSLSEQNLVDCSDSYGNMGCSGGLMTQAMQYIIGNGGIDTEASYPYTAVDGTCVYNPANSGATLKSFHNVISGNETDLQVNTMAGPTSVAIDAANASFQFYSSGVYYEPACSSQALDHGVLSIGWGTDSTSGMDYWIVKNSWGTSWGNQGFIWMARNKGNNCGIATMATLPQC